VFRFEDLADPSEVHIVSAANAVLSALNFRTTLHLYVSGKEALALCSLHTDPYDVR
jgi:hypothetical protein